MTSLFPKTPTTFFEKYLFFKAFSKTQSRLIKQQQQQLILADQRLQAFQKKNTRLKKKLKRHQIN